MRSVTAALPGPQASAQRMTKLHILGGGRSRRLFGLGRLFGSGRRGTVVAPLHERLSSHLGSVLVAGFALSVAITGVIYGDHYRTFRQAHGEPRDIAARILGLGVERITISGIAELNEREILHIAGINPLGSLAFLDVNEARRRLEANPLVRQATVRKLYPGEVAISVVEREPAAIWQFNGELFLVSGDGTVIDEMRDGRFASLPLVVGEHANLRAREYIALLADAGPLRGRIRGAILVSGRRWTLKMDNGLDIRLPEQGTVEALKRLVALEQDDRVLDRDVLAIDLRQPDRVTFRLTEEAAFARAEIVKTKTRKKGGEA
jgi:cell division protein FtsQ